MKPLRIATYNIHKARGMDGRTKLDRIARVLAEVDADVVGLQEVVGDQGRRLGERLGYFVTMGETREHKGEAYGNVTLSRKKIVRSVVADITVPGREARAVLRTDIAVAHHVVHLFNAHLGTAFFERRKQALRLFEHDLLRALDLRGPRVLLGDFNEWTQGLVSRRLREEFGDPDLRAHLPRRRTYPALLPFLHLDHIYFDNHLEVHHAAHFLSPLALAASDHLPLVAEFRLRGSERGN